MKEKISKNIFASELILIVFPLTALWVYGGSLAVYVAVLGKTEYGLVSSLMSALIVTLSLASLWFLGLVFLRKGSAILFKQNGFLWGFLGIGLLYCFGGLIFLLSMVYKEHSISETLQFFRFGVFGLPLAIPLLHLFLESRREC